MRSPGLTTSMWSARIDALARATTDDSFGTKVCRCECTGECGADHALERCPEVFGQPGRYTDHTRILLHPIHLNRRADDWRLENIRMVCQPCLAAFNTGGDQ